MSVRVGSALVTGSQRVDCDRCGGHACPHAYRLWVARDQWHLCGTCLLNTAQALLDYYPHYGEDLAAQWRPLRAERG